MSGCRRDDAIQEARSLPASPRSRRESPSLWYSIVNMLSPEQIEEWGLRKEQHQNTWIVRLASALQDCASDHPPEPWAANLKAENERLREEKRQLMAEFNQRGHELEDLREALSRTKAQIRFLQAALPR